MFYILKNILYILYSLIKILLHIQHIPEIYLWFYNYLIHLIYEINHQLNNYYLDIIYFLIKVCKAYNVQLFITTHNEEIIDVLSKYNKNNDVKTMMQFYTVKKKNNKTISRVLSDLDVEKISISF